MAVKRFAGIALVVLAVVLTLCMFFSGTIRTILNPKVSVITAKTGPLSTPFNLSCAVEYRNKCAITLSVPSGTLTTLVVTQSTPVIGEKISKGDVLYRFKYDGAEQEKTRLEKNLENAISQLTSAQMTYDENKPRKSEIQYFEAYDAYIEASNSEYLARVKLEELGYTKEDAANLLSQIDKWTDTEKADIVREYAKCANNLAAAENAYRKVQDNPPRSSVKYAYDSLKQAKQNVQEAKEELARFNDNTEKIASLSAQEDGIVASANIKLGDRVYNGATLCEVCDEKDVVLTADIQELNILPQAGIPVKVITNYGTMDSVVESVGLDSSSRRVMTIAMPQDMETRGISLRMMDAGVIKVSGAVQSEEEYTLLPAGAIHGSREKYIYLLNEKETVLGGKSYVLKKYQVSVMGEASGMVGIKETLGTKKVAYLEDKPLEDGQTVTLVGEMNWSTNK